MGKGKRKRGSAESQQQPAKIQAQPTRQVPDQSGRVPSGGYRAELHQGPLPAPRAMEEYDRILPGSAQAILDMATGQQTHRFDMDHRAIDLEEKYLEAYRERSKWGQVLALVITFGALALAAYALHLSYPKTAAVISSFTVSAIGIIYYLGEKPEDPDKAT